MVLRWGGYARVGKGIWKVSGLPSLFCWKPKTALKNKSEVN